MSDSNLRGVEHIGMALLHKCRSQLRYAREMSDASCGRV